MNERDEADWSGPGEAFATLGNETRVAILHELWAAAREGPLPFSELRERVGTRDSGQFNYHLTKLCDRFVRKTDGGYTLRAAGGMVVAAMLAGQYEDGGFDGPVSTGDPCPDCGGEVALTYEDERATIACLDCDYAVASANVPPGVFEGRDRTDAPVLFDRWLRTRVAGVAGGFCMACQGPTEARVAPAVDEGSRAAKFAEATDVHVEYECGRCGEVVLSTVPEAVVHDPAVVAFYHEHGLDVGALPSWQLPWLTAAPAVVSEDPLRVGVTVTLGDDALSLTVDGGVDVVSTDAGSVADAPPTDRPLVE
ncbi:winged helix-turn-helix domain-containing protein [Haloarchaeobius salinus]|uniref:winged helix-turn-helix domain-containing protein n=1 Tax=Haloarchaeobius salinus TaxID=1198298 RepID=UPI00210CCFD7|nr:winged helix-turn-helix domain-containing protein [Haloarchaeobius salinus]